MITRRAFAGFGAVFALPVLPGGRASAEEPTAEARFARIEAATGGRLGVSVREPATGRTLSYRAEERFPLCSTFKLLAAAAILARVDAGQEHLDRRIAYAASDLVDYSPTTKARLAEGAMPLADLCEAALTLSDNTAGNLMLGQIGGPPGLTRFLREHGDPVTRLDRTEPTLNEALPGDPRDTTSPNAMVANLDRFVLGRALSGASRATLEGWLLANRTGATRLRAGLPPDWRVGDKTGTGDRGTANDVGFLQRPDGVRILAAVYLTESACSPEQRNASIADVARTVFDNLKAPATPPR